MSYQCNHEINSEKEMIQLAQTNIYISFYRNQILRMKGSLPKSLFAQESSILLMKKVEEHRRLGQITMDLLPSLSKIIEIHPLQNEKAIHEIIDNPLAQPYYQELLKLYLSLIQEEKQLSKTILDSFNESSALVNAQVNQLHNDSLNLVNLLKNYTNYQQSCLQVIKKYYRSQKNLISSINSYKNSFNDVKLIYNMNEKNKRYFICQNFYKGVQDDLETVEGMCAKLNEKKQQILNFCDGLEIRAINDFYEISKIAFEQLLLFADGMKKYTHHISMKIKDEKNKLNVMDMKTFFITTSTDAVSINQLALLKIFIQPTNIPQSLLEEEITTYLKKFEKKVQEQKTINRKVVDFQIYYQRNLEKFLIIPLKQFYSMMQKVKKRVKDLLTTTLSTEFQRLQKLVEVKIKDLEELLKLMTQKIGFLNRMIEQQEKLFKILVKQLKQNCSKIITKNGKGLVQKGQFIIHLLTGFKQKVIGTLNQIKRGHNDILNDICLTMNGIESQFSDLKINQEDIEEKLKFIWDEIYEGRAKRAIGYKQILENQRNKIVFDGDLSKNEDFKKLKKPTQIMEAEQIKQQMESVQQKIEDSHQQPEPKQISKKQIKSKHLEFLETQITFMQEEQLIKSFSCALADKIILQGRLFITSKRICFFSKFNTDNLFFGDNTFIQIPKKDILKLEKKKNGIFFDNSISITTINGEIFLTSFLKRNQAFQLIQNMTDLNWEQKAYEFDENDNFQDETDEAQVEADDDIKEEQIPYRAQKIDEIIEKFNFKNCTSIEFKIENMTAYKIFKTLYMNEEVIVNRRKYPSFLDYFKKSIDHTDIDIKNWSPDIVPYLNSMSFKSDCPIRSNRTITSTFPVMKSPIPFMPKTAHSLEDQSIYLISRHKWIFENIVISSGAPYTDCFKVYYQTIGESNNEGHCKITTKMHIYWIKNTMMKSIIQSKSQQQSANLLSKMYRELKKYLESVVEKKNAKKSDQEMIPGNEDQHEYEQIIQELKYEIQQQNKEKEELRQQLEGQRGKQRNLLGIFIAIYIVSLLVLKLCI